MTIETKPCKYGCGEVIYWDNTILGFKPKWRETGSGKRHDYKRCAELLKEQGKKLVK